MGRQGGAFRFPWKRRPMELVMPTVSLQGRTEGREESKDGSRSSGQGRIGKAEKRTVS